MIPFKEISGAICSKVGRAAVPVVAAVFLVVVLCSSFATHHANREVLPYAPEHPTPPHAPKHPTPSHKTERAVPPSAEEIIKQACTEATTTHKKVMVLFHASWCTWCHKLDTLMASPECKPLFDQSFVVCHLTIAESPDKRDQENPGAEDLYAKYADQNSGIPFFLIMTPDGSVIADSRIKPTGAKPGSSGNNIGYPASKAEVEYYLRTLRETTTLTASQLKIIRDKLVKS